MTVPRFHVRASYSTHGNNPRDAVGVFFSAIHHPGSVVVEVFPDHSAVEAVEEFDGDDLCQIADAARHASGELISYTEPGEEGETQTMTVAQHKLCAIRARLNGILDHPALTPYGASSASLSEDVWRILNAGQ